MRSNGLEACDGSSFLFESAPSRLNPVNIRGSMSESHPPASMASASPHLTFWKATPSACVPDVHAVETVSCGPVSSYRDARAAASTNGE